MNQVHCDDWDHEFSELVSDALAVAEAEGHERELMSLLSARRQVQLTVWIKSFWQKLIMPLPFVGVMM